METTKWYANPKVIGIVISLIGKAVAAIFGIEISEQETAHASDAAGLVISGVVSLIGDFIAIRAKVKAKKLNPPA